MRLMPLITAAALLAVVSACSDTVAGNGSGGPKATASTSSSPSQPASSSETTSQPPSTPATSSSAPTSKIIPPPATPLRTVTVTTTISGKTYVIKIWVDKKDPTCADHAYGTPVINYLTAHPCGGLERLLATTTVNGRGVGFAESRLGFLGQPDGVYKVAGDFIKLVTQDGTGNIDDLLRDGYRLPSGPTAVPSPDAFSALGQDAGVIIDDIWYLNGSTPANDPALVQFARDIFLQFG